MSEYSSGLSSSSSALSLPSFSFSRPADHDSSPESPSSPYALVVPYAHVSISDSVAPNTEVITTTSSSTYAHIGLPCASHHTPKVSTSISNTYTHTSTMPCSIFVQSRQRSRTLFASAGFLAAMHCPGPVMREVNTGHRIARA
eukprot:3018638-Rhodomonas_salina.1